MEVENLVGKTSTEQQSRPDPKGKAIASLAFACIGIIIQLVVHLQILNCYKEIHEGLACGAGFIFFEVPNGLLFGFLGLNLGFKGLKSTKRTLAIIGIILSIILIFSPPILFFLNWTPGIIISILSLFIGAMFLIITLSATTSI